MSLRPYFNGFDLQKMNQLFGSGDSAAQQAAIDFTNNLFDGVDSETVKARRECATIITRAINKGVPFRGLDGEGERHVCSAVALAKAGQSFFRPDANDDSWNITVMKDLLAQDGNQFDDSTRKLLAFLRDGRSLFGKRIITGWSYYAFLIAAEVRELAAGIRSTQKANPKLTDQNYFDGFLIALLGWLDKIGKRKMDLFLYTA